jgi:methylated-DNA-[protein]-cysteine S-methyltransferase
MSLALALSRHPSPVGEIRLVTDAAGGLRALDFEGYDDRMRRLLRLHYGEVILSPGAAPAPVTAALTAYFEGDLRAVEAVPTVTRGTNFQRAVWAALQDIPPGETQAYGQLAARLGRPAASRAVGAANGANPVAIIVPCHRVIGASGSLTGFGGGLDRKAWLLAHERQHRGPWRLTP